MIHIASNFFVNIQFVNAFSAKKLQGCVEMKMLNIIQLK